MYQERNPKLSLFTKENKRCSKEVEDIKKFFFQWNKSILFCFLKGVQLVLILPIIKLRCLRC